MARAPGFVVTTPHHRRETISLGDHRNSELVSCWPQGMGRTCWAGSSPHSLTDRTTASVCLRARNHRAGGARLGFLGFRRLRSPDSSEGSRLGAGPVGMGRKGPRAVASQMAGTVRVALRPSLSQSPQSCCQAGGWSVLIGRVNAH